MKQLPFWTFAVCLLAASACSDDKGTTPEPTGSLLLRFDYEVSGQPLVIGTGLDFTNAAGNRYNVSGLKHYVCDVVLKRDNGTRFESSALALLNADDPNAHTLLVEGIPPGRYASLRFLVGVDDARNEPGRLTTLEDANMEWPLQWGGGYHNVKMEGFFEGPSGENLSWGLHMGKMSHGDDKGFHNHVAEIILTGYDLEVNGDDWRTNVVLDVNGLFTSPLPVEFNDWFDAENTTIMTNHLAQETIIQNARDAFRITGTTQR